MYFFLRFEMHELIKGETLELILVEDMMLV